MNDKAAITDSTLQQRARLRKAGILVLVFGIGSACLLYWIRTRTPNHIDDPMMSGYSKPEVRQMEMLYGKMGKVSSDLLEELKHPGTQAILIGAISTLIAITCFLLADRWVDDREAS